jgi:hypothetical protein
MSGLNIGQAKTDPVDGVAGLIWTQAYSDPDSNINPGYVPAPPTLSPSPGALTPGELAIRKNLGAGMGATAAALAGLFSFGSGTIPHGSNSVTIADTSVNASTVLAPAINQTPDGSLTAISGYTVNPGVGVTIYGNSNPSSTSGVVVTYIALNPPP